MNRNVRRDSNLMEVLTALSNHINYAKNDKTVPDISVTYLECMEHEIDKKSTLRSHVVVHFWGLCEYFKMNIFLPNYVPF